MISAWGLRLGGCGLKLDVTSHQSLRVLQIPHSVMGTARYIKASLTPYLVAIAVAGDWPKLRV